MSYIVPDSGSRKDPHNPEDTMLLTLQQAAVRLQNKLGAGWRVSHEDGKLVATWVDDPSHFEQARQELATGHYRGFDVEVRCQQAPTAS